MKKELIENLATNKTEVFSSDHNAQKDSGYITCTDHSWTRIFIPHVLNIAHEKGTLCDSHGAVHCVLVLVLVHFRKY